MPVKHQDELYLIKPYHTIAEYFDTWLMFRASYHRESQASEATLEASDEMLYSDLEKIWKTGRRAFQAERDPQIPRRSGG